jgi:tetratricopeptide (TPR) repeat protein
MACGYLLALIPTLLILIGAAIALYRYLRQPSVSHFLLLTSCAAIVMGLALTTISVASHSSVKAFYGFAALVPLCFFCGLGWDAVTRGRKPREFVVGVLLILWSLNSLSAVWVRHSVAQQVYTGLKFQFEKKIDNAILEGVAAIRSDPLNATARRFLAQVFDESGRSSEALEQAQQAVKLAPEDSDCFLELGALLLKRGDGEQATNIARRAIELGPENLRARRLLLLCLFNLNHYQEAVDSTKDALAMSPFDPWLHYASAQASMATEDFALATKQFGYAFLLRPDWEQARIKFREALFSLATTPDALRQLQEVASSAPDSPVVLNDLAWLFATNTDSTLRNGARAVQLAERASAMSGRQNATFLNTLAAAYAETGRFSEAIASAERALALAELANNGTTAALSQTLLKSFRANQPYHVEPTRF